VTVYNVCVDCVVYTVHFFVFFSFFTTILSNEDVHISVFSGEFCYVAKDDSCLPDSDNHGMVAVIPCSSPTCGFTTTCGTKQN